MGESQPDLMEEQKEEIYWKVAEEWGVDMGPEFYENQKKAEEEKKQKRGGDVFENALDDEPARERRTVIKKPAAKVIEKPVAATPKKKGCKSAKAKNMG